ncbi:uncharacterized protein F4812DRAFT_460936 [Daldinia caldariorum]|uniref:uncharacterized protein n=1 Tax=Daldinia caldariorum TaxID=326644 RepID=UPI0020074BFB|nr:uncharacterized protein F4812DRAFT_460936 [Daldinia caldariorum]KAI1465957.1 hypothetical protein F4812DRAFT_460936 [Daldinia caldariorum]
MDMGNEEDPQINKNDGGSIPSGPSSSQDPSRAATSSHEKYRDQDDRLASAPTRRRGPTGRSSKSTATASSPSTSSSSIPRPALMSRQSTTSSELMDPTTYGGHAQGSSSGGGSMASSSMPTRPMGNIPGEGGMPVKLTPITGRVSRAKKGVPVHTCDICKPPKTFTRAEHLRRHQLSHRTPGFPCTFPGCDKAFHRADLLARHTQRHDHDDKASSGGMSRPPSAGTLEDPNSGLSYMTHSHSSMDGGLGSRPGMPGPSDNSSGTSYPGSMSTHYQMSGQGNTSGGNSMSPSQHPGRGDSYQNSPNAPNHTYVLSGLINNQTPSIGGSPIAPGADRFFGLDIQPRTSSPYPTMFMDPAILPHTLPSLTIPDNSIPPGLVHASHDGSPWPSSASESNYSTPSDISHRRNMNAQAGYESPISSDWPLSYHSMQSPGGGLEVATTASFFGSAFSSMAPNMDQTLNLSVPFSDEQSFVDQQYPSYSSVRSPTPPTISLSAQSNEHLVTLTAPSIPDAASAGARQKGSTMLLGPLQGTAFLTASALPLHVRNVIPKYLQAYWKSFDTLAPVVHRKSVETAADEVLRCAMAAVGAQYLQGKDDRIRANELHEFAWKEVKTRTKWNLQVMQTIILCEFYARFRGRSVLRHPSESFQSLYSRDSLFSFVMSSPNGRWYPYSTCSSLQMANHQMPDKFLFSASTRNERWNEWIDNESRRRLLAACFVLDAHTSLYYQQHVIQQFPMSTFSIPLIRPTEDLWAAPSSEAWEALLDTKPANAGPLSYSGEPPTAEQVMNARYLDRAIFLTSEALRLPKRSNPSVLDLSVEVDLTCTEQMSRLFPGSAVGNTYLALHYTPLHDLLAVSGDTWLFSRKVASPQVFQQHKKRLQQWCGSPYAGAAAGFAAKALLAFLDGTESRNYNTLNTAVSSELEEEEDAMDLDKSWNMLDISDYWAVHVCALICWALGHRSMVRNNGAFSGSGSDCSSPRYDQNNDNNGSNANAGEAEEREAIRWLKRVAGLSAADLAVGARSQRESMGVISMVRRRLEDEAVGTKSRLLVDAVGTLKKLEERVGYKWF